MSKNYENIALHKILFSHQGRSPFFTHEAFDFTQKSINYFIPLADWLDVLIRHRTFPSFTKKIEHAFRGGIFCVRVTDSLSLQDKRIWSVSRDRENEFYDCLSMTCRSRTAVQFALFLLARRKKNPVTVTRLTRRKS